MARPYDEAMSQGRIGLPVTGTGSPRVVTGFTCDYAGDWYCERTGRARKAFMKVPVAVDPEREPG